MDETLEVTGKVIEVLPNTLFRVIVEVSQDLPELIGKVLLCHISGKMRLRYIRLLAGDRVRVQMSPKYDLEKGRIVQRMR